jgi:hypothetical protein
MLGCFLKNNKDLAKKLAPKSAKTNMKRKKSEAISDDDEDKSEAKPKKR